VKTQLLCLLLVFLFGIPARVQAAPPAPVSDKRLVLPVPHAQPIFHLSPSPNGEFLATADGGGTLKIWDQSSGELQQTLTTPRGSLPLALHWVSDSQLLCYGSDFRYHIYDQSTGQKVASHPEKPYRSQGGIGVAQGRLYLSPADSGPRRIECWDPVQWKLLHSWPIPEAVGTLCVAPAGDRVALTLGQRFLELEDGKVVRQLDNLPSSLYLAGYSRDGKRLAAYDDKGCYLVDDTLQGPLGKPPLRTLAWVGSKLQYLNEGQLYEFDPQQPQNHTSVGTRFAENVFGLGVAFHDQFVLATAKGDLVRARDHKAALKQPALSPIHRFAANDHGQIFAALQSGPLVCWSAKTGRREKIFAGNQPVQGMAVSRDGKSLAVTRGGSDQMEIIDCQRLEPKGSLPLGSTRKGLRGLIWSHDGRFVAGTRLEREGNFLEVYQPSSSALVLREAMKGTDIGYAFHPRQARLAWATSSEVIELDLDKMARTAFSNYGVSALAYDPQGGLFGLSEIRPGELTFHQVVDRPPGQMASLVGARSYEVPTQFRDFHLELSYDLARQGWIFWSDRGGCFLLGDEAQPKRLLPDGVNSSIGRNVSWKYPLFINVGREATLEFWKAGQEQPLGYLLAMGEGQDWLVTDRWGHFDGTPEAERRVEWWVGNRRTRIDQLFQEGYRPGLLKSFLGSGQEPVNTTSVGLEIQPPQVQFVSPAPGARIAEKQIEVAIKVQEQGNGASQPRLFVNGHAVASKAQRGPDGLFRFQARLQPGVNELRCTATDASGKVSSRGDKLRFACLADSRRPKLMVIAAGLNDTGSAAKLRYAESDAQALAKGITSPMFSSCEVRLLAGKQVSLEALQKTFKDLGKEAEPQDTLVFFLAGHGSADDQGYRFVMPKGQPQLEGTTLIRWLREFPAQKQLVILDTCHAGAASDDLADSFAINQQRLARGSGVYLLAACRSEQSALELSTLEHGLLTYSLLQGLKSAPVNSRQELTVSGLTHFVCTQVPDLCREVGMIQDVFQYVRGSDFPLRLKTTP